MSGIGSRKYVGSKAFMSNARGRPAAAAEAESPAEAAQSALNPEVLLEMIERMEPVADGVLAANLAVTVEDLTPHLEKLQCLELVTGNLSGQNMVYSLSDVGRRARQFARMA